MIYSLNKGLILLKVINKCCDKKDDENDFAYLFNEFGESYSGLKKGFTSTEKSYFGSKKQSDRRLWVALALNIKNIDLEELLALFLKFKSVIFSASLGAVQIQTM